MAVKDMGKRMVMMAEKGEREGVLCYGWTFETHLPLSIHHLSVNYGSDLNAIARYKEICANWDKLVCDHTPM